MNIVLSPKTNIRNNRNMKLGILVLCIKLFDKYTDYENDEYE